MGVEIKTGSPVKSIKDTLAGGHKAVFLGIGAARSQKMGIPGEDTPGVMAALDLLGKVNSGEKVTLGNRVAVIGGGNAAIDAARTARRLGAEEVSIIYRRSRVEMPAIASEIAEAEEEGIKLAILAAPVAVLATKGKVSGLKCIRMELGEPDESGRRRPVPIEGSEYEVAVDNVVMAIGQTVDKAALSDELAYTERGTIKVDPLSRQTSLAGVFAGGDTVSGPSTVIEAIAAGKEAAISIDRYLRGENLKEGRPTERNKVEEINKEGAIKIARADIPLAAADQRQAFSEVELGFDDETAIAEASRCLNCGICSECRQCVTSCDPEAIDFEQQDEIVEIEVGNIIVATGFDQFNPGDIVHYGYGRLDNVITGLQFERMANASGPTLGQILLKNGKPPKSVALVHCVGSRDKNYNAYCSQICCMHSLKHAHLIKERTGAQIYEMYIDIRCTGKGYEEFYERLSNEGINFVRGKVSQVTDRAIKDEEKGKLVVVCEDTTLGNTLRVPVDMVVLSTAVVPRADAEAVGRLFGVGRSADGFFLEKHPKLDPVATMNNGVYVVGCAQGPKDIPQSVTQASAAAARALAMISKGRVELEPCISQVIDENCDGCAYCVDPCPFEAITLIEYMKDGMVKKTVESDPVKCHGCGVCMATCPKKGIKVLNFSLERLSPSPRRLPGWPPVCAGRYLRRPP